jgi:hypothetical protein
MRRGSHTYKIGQNINRVGKVQAEYDPLFLTWCAATFFLIEFGIQVVACKDAAQYTANPRLLDIGKLIMEPEVIHD